MRAYDSDFLGIADNISKKSDAKQQMGAVIVKYKDILSKGYNRNVSLYKILTKYGLMYSIHAEMDALRKIPYGEAKGATIYVSRLGGRTSRPCDNCKIILKKAGIKRAVFYDEQGDMDVLDFRS